MKRPFTIETASASIQSSIRNAVISFDEMTVSVIKVTFENNGHQVNGYGFCSNGRYAQEGIIKNRFMPRLYKVSPDSLLDDNGVIDPLKCWSVFMQNEKPGGHGDRAVAAGALDMA
ncbi:MAG: mandelate racemase, partial [Deltaproteobacteria bacterium]